MIPGTDSDLVVYEHGPDPAANESTIGASFSTTSIVTSGNVAPDQSRVYQHWFRDQKLSPCGSGSILSAARC